MDEPDLGLPNIADGEDKSSVLGNRIRKNYRHIRKWAKRTNTNCFRIYDREIHQYPLAIDFYAGRFCVQYFSRSRMKDAPPDELVEEVSNVLRTVFNADDDKIYWRIRSKQKETRQYEKQGESKEFFTVLEYGTKFRVNLSDYLDTGLFLDHRETRKYVAEASKDKRVLNLFAYTCAFSVQAAAAGSSYTKSIDMSNTYTAWGKDNFLLNAFPLKNNEVVRADCMRFLKDEVNSGCKYDIIVIDPPTISRSKKMSQLFDVQIDYVFLISKALQLLTDQGIIFFSTNLRKFIFNEALFEDCSIIDITHKTIPNDFHDKKIHKCWQIKKLTNKNKRAKNE